MGSLMVHEQRMNEKSDMKLKRPYKVKWTKKEIESLKNGVDSNRTGLSHKDDIRKVPETGKITTRMQKQTKRTAKHILSA